VQIEKEINLLKRHYHITATNPVTPIEAELLPRHVWQKTYIILIKTNIFLRRHALSGFSPVTQEPVLKIDPRENWGQIQRILTEIKIAKKYLGISAKVSPATAVKGKYPTDVFNKLNQVSYDMDTLNREPISPSYAYAEGLRLNEDINVIMQKTNSIDTAVPPARNEEAQPLDALKMAFILMGEIQRIQHQLGYASFDFNVFRKIDKETVVPADVFNMVSLCLGELQIVKAQLGMIHSITLPAELQKDKTPTEVTQFLGYMTNKLRLITVN